VWGVIITIGFISIILKDRISNVQAVQKKIWQKLFLLGVLLLRGRTNAAPEKLAKLNNFAKLHILQMQPCKSMLMRSYITVSCIHIKLKSDPHTTLKQPTLTISQARTKILPYQMLLSTVLTWLTVTLLIHLAGIFCSFAHIYSFFIRIKILKAKHSK